VDGFFGIYARDADGKQYYLVISPWQLYIIGQHTDMNDSWEILDFHWSGAGNAGYATNTFEISIRPSMQESTAG
jgi:hypothetical protein